MRYNRSGELTDMNEILCTSVAASGPALKSRFQEVISTVDYVSSIFCPNWPLAADEWPKRKRYSGWPNSATIRKVVLEGCDVVSVAHRDMHTELYQHRLSFSRAEVTLIQSWTPTQQIVYHLLRYFAKIETFRKNCPKKKRLFVHTI